MQIDWIMHNIDMLKVRAKMMAALGTMYGVENKTIAEINREAELIILKEFERVIRYYDRDYKLGKLTTIGNVLDDLLNACYDHAKSMGENNIENAKWKLFYEKLAVISDKLFKDYKRKLKKFRRKSKSIK
jgi:RNA polymerase-interacting CarD/CdnL/TRCF family regulator